NRPCKFAVGSRANIVAIGHVQNLLDGTLLHGREIEQNNYHVSIEIAFNHNASLPIINLDDPDTSNIGLALGSHVAWPKFRVVDDRIRRQPSQKSTSQLEPPVTQERIHLLPKNKDSSLTQTQGGADDPVSVRLLLKSVNDWDDSGLVHIPFDE
ncbi:hypothetical protein TorRG33x02_174670, partial [Trema orientale]